MNINALVLKSASTLAPEVNKAMFALLLICGSMLILVFSLIIFFSIRYRKNSRHSREIQKKSHTLLEWGWTFGSLFIFVAIFVWGAVIYFKMHVAPPGAAEVMVVGKQWMWKFQHANGRSEINELHVPVNEPILLTMISQDVIHSVFVPDFRLKQDVLPGRYTKTWFEASEIGEYQLYCTQYCGTMHADMMGRVFVLSDHDYQIWLKNEPPSDSNQIRETMAARGEKLFFAHGCISCHSDGSKQLGPSLRGIFGSRIKLSTGASVLVDEDFIRESILTPSTKTVHGYKPIMPPYIGRISEEGLLDLVAYIKSLKVKPPINSALNLE